MLFLFKPEGRGVKKHANNGKETEYISVEQKTRGDYRNIDTDNKKLQMLFNDRRILLLCQERSDHARNIECRTLKRPEQYVLQNVERTRGSVEQNYVFSLF